MNSAVCIYMLNMSTFLRHDWDATGAVTISKRCSFSLLQLIKPKPELTPSWLSSCRIISNLILMTDCGGGVDCVCVRKSWRWWRGRGWGCQSNILFLKSMTLTPSSSSFPPYPLLSHSSSPHITESASADKRRHFYKVTHSIMQHTSCQAQKRRGFTHFCLAYSTLRASWGNDKQYK